MKPWGLAMDFYHDGMRQLQDRYEGRSVADRLARYRMRAEFNEGDREFIESSAFFFLATATTESVDCSFKGVEPGFVRVIGANVVAWPDYDGNRMYRSLGNIVRNPRVGLLFVRTDGTLSNSLPWIARLTRQSMNACMGSRAKVGIRFAKLHGKVESRNKGARM